MFFHLPPLRLISQALSQASLLSSGTTVIVKRRGKLVFIKHRIEEDAKLANSIELASLRDPQPDAMRVKNTEWLIVMGRSYGCKWYISLVAQGDNWKYEIVSFELSNEAIKTTALPDAINSRISWQTTFSLNECVALPLCDDSHVELWVLLEYGVKESWTKLFTIACPENGNQSLRFSSNGELFLATWKGQLVVWNTTTEGIGHIRANGVPETLQTITYMEPHIPLKVGNKFEDEQNF
ncbi:hypothetical protein GH714_029223 [Hevea brasiliensis]|uniref:F-box associated domain-containing protein n=1 Tax=Hevea brasiliensis TaxID=3981 RepID=A0A6A6LLA5_HEVBR|nr:hypothetical protein GH714_029223 [Hevea brasiliensis]